MTKIFPAFLLMAIYMLSGLHTYAQPDSVIQVGVFNEIDAFEDPNSNFPPKRKDNWALGLNGGVPVIQGDLRSIAGWGAGLSLQRALGHTFSMRYQGIFGITRGQDWRPSVIEQTITFRNYKTWFTDHSIQGVLSTNNIKFFKRQASALLYGFGGVGVLFYNNQQDIIGDNNQAYDYSFIGVPTSPNQKGTVLSNIDRLVDGNYETDALGDPLRQGSGEEVAIRPSIILGTGVSFRLSKRVDLNLEYRMSWHNDDFLDGENRTRTNEEATSTKDLLHYPNVSVVFKIGKKGEPLWWNNPMTKTYSDINQIKSVVNRISSDDDGDGVLDIVDQEPNTPPGVAVNTKGVTDSTNAVLLGKITEEIGRLTGNIAELAEQTQKSIQALEARLEGVDGEFHATILYDYNSAKIKKEFYPELLRVATYLKSRPNSKVIITGFTDNRASEEYNQGLAGRRVRSAIIALTQYFSIPEGQIESEIMGEANPLIPDLPDTTYPNLDGAHYLNRRVTFNAID